MPDDIYAWREPLSKRIYFAVSEGRLHLQATVFWPDELETLQAILTAVEPFLTVQGARKPRPTHLAMWGDK